MDELSAGSHPSFSLPHHTLIFSTSNLSTSGPAPAVADAANEAVKLHGTPLAERPLKVTYSKNAINKGPKKLDSETLRRVREAELRILQRDKNLELAAAASGGSDGERRRREKSRSRSYDGTGAATDAVGGHVRVRQNADVDRAVPHHATATATEAWTAPAAATKTGTATRVVTGTGTETGPATVAVAAAVAAVNVVEAGANGAAVAVAKDAGGMREVERGGREGPGPATRLRKRRRLVRGRCNRGGSNVCVKPSGSR
ncbi:hypothetical protein BC830DRAFT_1175761 [Chytriomyces sp. MP71]|nr:hypothetical protein BC830DRAFT_1175761 [Chytriomyces sp. MP71]